IIVDIPTLAFESGVADSLQLVLDLRARGGLRPALRGAQGGDLLELRVELAIDIVLLQQMTLDLAARGLGDTLHRHDSGDLESRLLVDETRNLRGERQELLHPAPVQHEYQQLLGLGAARLHTGGNHFAELRSRSALRGG